MRFFWRTSRLGLLLVLCFLLLPDKEAHAYIDPATGSYITQIMVAVLVGGLFVVKQYLAKIKEFIKNLTSKKKQLD